MYRIAKAWKLGKLQELENTGSGHHQRTRKLMTIHKALNSRDDKDRLHMSRKEGRIRPANIEDYTDTTFIYLGNALEATKLQSRRKQIIFLTYIDDIKIFAKN